MMGGPGARRACALKVPQMRRRWDSSFLHTAGLIALMLSAAATATATAADYSPWVDRPPETASTVVELAQRQDPCCKHCTKGQPCGNTCISAKAKCKSPPGCAC